MHVMRTIKPGMKEYQAEATFLHHTYFYGGARYILVDYWMVFLTKVVGA
jgi:hypothetical protein